MYRTLIISHPGPGSRESVLWMAETGFRHQMANSHDMTVLICSGDVPALALNP